jgi:hypothetical protein
MLGEKHVPPGSVVPMGDSYDRIASLLLTRGIKPFYKLRQFESMNFDPENIEKFRDQIRGLSQLASRKSLIG